MRKHDTKDGRPKTMVLQDVLRPDEKTLARRWARVAIFASKSFESRRRAEWPNRRAALSVRWGKKNSGCGIDDLFGLWLAGEVWDKSGRGKGVPAPPPLPLQTLVARHPAPDDIGGTRVLNFPCDRLEYSPGTFPLACAGPRASTTNRFALSIVVRVAYGSSIRGQKSPLGRPCLHSCPAVVSRCHPVLVFLLI